MLVFQICKNYRLPIADYLLYHTKLPMESVKTADNNKDNNKYYK